MLSINCLDTLQGDNLALLQAHVIRQKQKLSKLAALTDGSLSDGNPDRVYGARAEELALSARERLNDVIVPTPEENFICPNFVVHVKSDKGSELVARVQAAYDGALAARGMQRLWEFGEGPHDVASEMDSRGSGTGRDSAAALGARSDSLIDSSLAHADHTQPARFSRTITCTWMGGTLKMYAIYCEGSPEIREGAHSGDQAAGRPRYVPSLIGSWIMTDREKDFREGLAAYRNGLDWAKRQRDIVISRANARVQAEMAHGCRRGEQDPQEELDADEVQSEREDNYEEEDNSEQDDDDDGGVNSIFARRGSEARRQDEEDEDSEPADKDMFASFDSQRTVTRSMSRKLLDGSA